MESESPGLSASFSIEYSRYVIVHQRVTSRPETTALRRSCLKCWPHFERVPTTLNDKSGWLRRDCINSVVYAEHLLSFRASGILVCARQRMPTSPTPAGNPGH